jgi:hypothetical protein
LLACAHGVDERLGKLFAGGVAKCVQNAGKRVAAFKTKGKVIRVALFAIELGTPSEQLKHAAWAFFNDHANGRIIAQAGAADFGIADVRIS